MDEIADKFCDYLDLFAYRDRMKVNVLLHKTKGFDIKSESYIENNFKINKAIPDVYGIKNKEINEKILYAVSSETVKKESVLVKGCFEERYNSLTERQELQSMEKRLETLEKEKMELEKENKELREKKVQHITNVMIPRIYVNVKMNNLGDEDLMNLTPDDVKLMLEKSTNVPDFIDMSIRKIHYDREKPENHNIHITEKRDEHTKCIYYGNERWHLDAYVSSTTLSKLYRGKIKLLNRMLDEHIDDFSPKEVKLMREFKDSLLDVSDYHHNSRAIDVIYSSTKIDVPTFRQSLKELQ